MDKANNKNLANDDGSRKTKTFKTIYDIGHD